MKFLEGAKRGQSKNYKKWFDVGKVLSYRWRCGLRKVDGVGAAVRLSNDVPQMAWLEWM